MNPSTAESTVPTPDHRAKALLRCLAGVLTLCVALTTSARAQQQGPSEPFVGRFASASTRLTLTQESNGRITGQMTVGTTVLGLTASVHEHTGGAPLLRGDLTRGARSFGFEAQPTRDGLRVTSGGKTRELRRVGSSQPTSQPKVLRLHRRAIHDPMMNIPSHHVLLPEGFRIDGSPVWTPNAPAFQTMNVRIHDGSGAEIRFAPRQYFEYEPQQQLAMKGVRVGMRMPNGKMVMPPPGSREDLVQRYLVPNLRPQATDVRIKRFEDLPEATEALRRIPALNTPTVPGHQRQHTVEIAGVELSYTEGGRRYDENILYVYMQTDNVLNVGMGPRQNTTWVLDQCCASVRRVNKLKTAWRCCRNSPATSARLRSGITASSTSSAAGVPRDTGTTWNASAHSRTSPGRQPAPTQRSATCRCRPGETNRSLRTGSSAKPLT